MAFRHSLKIEMGWASVLMHKSFAIQKQTTFKGRKSEEIRFFKNWQDV